MGGRRGLSGSLFAQKIADFPEKFFRFRRFRGWSSGKGCPFPHAVHGFDHEE